ncbi:MAG: patatin-like phospholipase family protein [Dehalococcoidales bacterium]|nr:patatin-like phospholipase family protein [Dehalococcoidales bacterium]
MNQRKVGLALGSGSARGIAHVGVLAVLEREGIPVDIIAGTSMGAIIGAFYAAGKDVNQITDAVMNLSRRKTLSLVADITLPRTGFAKGGRLEKWLESVIGDASFDDLGIPFACVATDINSGEEVVINQGSVVDGVRASASIPVIFSPAKWHGRYLVDGALVDPVPVRVAREMGADFVIAVNVIPYLDYRNQGNNPENLRKPNVFSVLMQTLSIMGYQVAIAGIRDADIVIAPHPGTIRQGDFHRAEESILRGQRAARHAIAEIKRQLGS